jgi:hypothetical protein
MQSADPDEYRIDHPDRPRPKSRRTVERYIQQARKAGYDIPDGPERSAFSQRWRVAQRRIDEIDQTLWDIGDAPRWHTLSDQFLNKRELACTIWAELIAERMPRLPGAPRLRQANEPVEVGVYCNKYREGRRPKQERDKRRLRIQAAWRDGEHRLPPRWVKARGGRRRLDGMDPVRFLEHGS